jgi:hemolysin-activating ACP:hemolysin acyltransferase
MSSAIEVLKTMLEIRKKPNLFVSECCKDPFEDRRIAEANALGEAIVALEKQENYVIDFIRLEVFPKSKKEQFRVFFKDGTEQVFQMKRVGEQK